MSNYSECQEELLSLSKEKGYLTFDDIIDAATSSNLSATEVDQLNERIQLKGILVYEAPPAETSSQDEDYSKIDYEAIYTEIIETEPSLEALINQVRSLPTAQYGEILTLTTQAHSGNDFARERLVLLHLRVVLKIALTLSKLYDFNLIDAVSEGISGLIHSINKFDVNGFSAFQQYSSLWIKQYIHRFCIPIWMCYYYPYHVRERMYSIARICKERYGDITEDNLQSQALINDCELETGLSSSKVKDAIALIIKDIHKRLPIDFDDCESEPMGKEYLYNENNEMEEDVDLHLLKQNVNEALDSLSSREKLVIQMRFGIGGYHESTLDEIGQSIGVTRERIRQLEDKAMRKLRLMQSIKNLKDYL